MNILQAVQDRNLFRKYVSDKSLKSYVNWLSFLKTLYGITPTEREHQVISDCTGRDTFPQEGFTEALVLCGRRSGKSKMIALVGAYEAVLSGREKNLSAGEIPMVAILSPTRFQSRIIYTYLKGCLESTPMLRAEIAEDRQGGFVLKNGVEIAVITGDPRTCRGFSVIAAIVDEIAFFGLSEESKVCSDTELIRSLRPSLGTTGGRLLCVGSPYAARGYAFTLWKKHWGNPTGRVLVWNAFSRVMNPTLPQSVIDAAMEDDPVAARVEYVTVPGAFREDVADLLPRDLVEALVVPGRKELPPQADINYSAFADVSGGRVDDAALAIGHKEGDTVIVDHLERHKSPHNPYEVVAKMVTTLRRYNVKKVAGDAYSAAWVKESFASHGIQYEHSWKSQWNEGTSAKNKVKKPKSELYLGLVPRMTSGQIELLDDETLISQLASLQRRSRSGGRDSVDHPPGGHDDSANAVAGLADVAVQKRITAGLIGGDGIDSFAKKELTDRWAEHVRRREEELNGSTFCGSDPGEAREAEQEAMNQLHRTDPFFQQFRRR